MSFSGPLLRDRRPAMCARMDKRGIPGRYKEYFQGVELVTDGLVEGLKLGACIF